MTAIVSEAIEDATASEFVDPRPPGVGPFGKIGSIFLFAAIIMTGVLWKLVTWWLGLAFGLVMFPTLIIGCVRDPRTGLTRATKWNRRRMWRRGERRGTNQLVSGPVSQLGDFILPGYLAQTKLHGAVAANRQEYGLVELPATGDMGVAFAVEPDGASLLADETVLRFAKRWGLALKFLCNEPSAIQAMVTIRTAPDPGDSERDRILSQIRPQASQYSRQVLTELAGMTPPGAAIVTSGVTVVFESDLAGERRAAQQMADSIHSRLPAIAARLVKGGAGHCVLMSPQDICDRVQAAYDPGSAKHIAKARAAGLDTGSRWQSIGPARADNNWRAYHHAGAQTVTWTMTDIEGAVNLTTLEPLIRGSADCDVVQLTLIYKLRRPAEKNHVASKDVKHAQFHEYNPNRTQGDVKRTTSASSTATDTAHGHGLVDISVIITASVMDKITTTIDVGGNEVQTVKTAAERVPAMVAAVEQAAPQAMFTIIRQDGGHAAVFAAGLGNGIPIVCSKFSKLPTTFQEDL